jgi:serine/threonine-protein kinase
MGRVLLAHDPVLDRDVAIKHLRDDLKIPREVRNGLITRMRHEARAAARVAHPNLVVLHDMGEDEEVGLFLVFEYVPGPTLKQRLVDERRLPAAEAARLAADLGAALTTAHEAGILHRDVKPENIILARTGGKLADFGIARIPDSTLTHQGGLMGTPAYSAPETFRAGKFSPASDQFSLAASLYEAISGLRAFPGDDAVAVAARIAHETPDRFAADLDLPRAVDEVLARGLARVPEERFPSCEAFGAALARSLTPPAAMVTPIVEVEASPAARPGHEPPRERSTGQVLLGAGVVVTTAALLVWAALRSLQAAPEITAAATPAPSVAAAPAPRPRHPAPSRPVRPHAEPPHTEPPHVEPPHAEPPHVEPPAPATAPTSTAAGDAGVPGGPPAPAPPSALPAATGP